MAFAKVIHSILLVIVTIVCSVSSDDVYIQVNLQRPVNIVSDKYVSFSIDPEVLLDNINATDSDISDFMAKQLKPSYLKISGNSFFKLLTALSNGERMDELEDSVPQTVWMNFNRWIRSVDWLPIVPLPYNPKKWDSVHALKILNISNSLGVKDCIWQLGIDFDPTDAPRYVDDLTTLRNVVGAFDDIPNHWGVVGADISAGSSYDETKLYADLAQDVVDAIGWIQPSEYVTYENQNHMIDSRDLALRAILSRRLPAWLTVPPKMLKNSRSVQNCSALCITEGLHWAQTLGDAARTGFNVVFKPLDRADIVQPGFSFYISWLFKKLMGEVVFDTKMLRGDRYISHFYSHCAKDISGGVTIMGINTDDIPSKIMTKLSYKYSGPELWQYVLTIRDGIVKLNGEQLRMNSTFEPLVKIKHPSKPMTLVLPPLSIGFWTLPSANIRECLREDIPEYDQGLYDSSEERSERHMTSSDRLLQELIKASIAATSQRASNKVKRHIVVKKDSNYLNQLVKDFDLDRDLYNQYTKPSELVRHKRFILQNNNRPRLFQNLFEIPAIDGLSELGGLLGFGGRQLGSPPPPPPTPPPAPLSVESSLDDTRRFKRVFPRLPFMRLDQLFNPRPTHRAKRQALNLFKLGPFAGLAGDNKPRLFQGIRKIMNPTASEAHVSAMTRHAPQPDEEHLLAPRKNIQFPEGDVHINITKIPDADYDYVEFDGGNNAEKKRKPAPVVNIPRMPTNFHETFAIRDVIPRVEHAAIAPPRHHLNEDEPESKINNLHLERARQQLESYYMPAETAKSFPASTGRKSKDSSDEEQDTVVQTRRKRNAVLKSISWALSEGDQRLTNIIERDGAGGSNKVPVFDRVVPLAQLKNYERSAKPRSLDEIEAVAGNEADNTVLEVLQPAPTPENQEDDMRKDIAKIRIIASAPASNPHTPKFMNYLTGKLNKFMDMLNDHVTGWWNTWV